MRKLMTLGLCAALLAGCEGDPSKPAYWVKKLDSKHPTDKVEAANRLRKMNDVQDAPKIAALLKDDDGRVKAAAAEALGALGDKSVVPALIDGIDYSAASSTDRDSRASNEANKQIVVSLGLLGDKQAAPALLKLTRAKVEYVKLEAVHSLGLLRDPSAVDTLVEIATDENTEPFIAKKAIMALGLIGDPKAVPAIEKMLFKERRGISFYSESSFAVFQIGEPAATPLIALLDGRDKATEKWAQDNQVLPEAVFAKTSQVLGDIGDRRAIRPLIAKLAYTGGDFQLLVRSTAAESLGRMRAKEAADPIAKMLGEDEANIRDAYGRALVMIGDPKTVPALLAAAQKGSWDAREGSIHALSNLGGAKELVEVQKMIAAEPARWQKECVDAGNEADACKNAYPKHAEALAQHVARLKAAAECGSTESCWIGKLKDPSGAVRERAAWELGRDGKADAVAPLLAALQDDDLPARFAECTALSWLLSGDAAKDQNKAADDRLNAILASEDGKTYYMKVNEDLKRLAVRLEKNLPRA